MIRAIFLFALMICLAAPSPAEAVWLFGGKKKEEAPADPVAPEAPAEPEKPTLYLKPKPGADPWALDLLMNKPQQQTQSPIFTGKLFEKLTPEMLTVTYTPKTAEEIGLIAVANNLWEIKAMTDMRAAAKKRVAVANAETQAALRVMRAANARELAAGMRESGATAGVKRPPQAAPSKQVVRENSAGEQKKPSPVFTNFR